jgi:hypothetical protein
MALRLVATAAMSCRSGVTPRCFSYSEVLLIGGKARGHRVGPADLLQARRDLGVVQGRIVAAVAADDLERAGIPAFYPAVHEADRLAPLTAFAQHGGQ